MEKEVLSEIRKLFKQAAKSKNSSRIVNRARRLAQKEREALPRELKKKFCNYCNVYWHVGENVRVRTQRGKVVYYCLECKHYRRFPYVKERKARRAKVNKSSK